MHTTKEGYPKSEKGLLRAIRKEGVTVPANPTPSKRTLKRKAERARQAARKEQEA